MVDVNQIDSDNILLPEGTPDLTNCDREPIHIPGSIQPHGALLVITVQGEVLHQSANLVECLGVDALNLSQHLKGFLHQDAAEKSIFNNRRNVIEETFNGQRFTISAHRIDGATVFEFEPMSDFADYGAFFDKSSNMIHDLQSVTSDREAYQQVVDNIRDLIGFDRVMAYVFDPEGHGSVVAESLAEQVEGFKGLRFPATDIPTQARRLYTLELTRQIVDVSYTPVPITPSINAITGKPFNMAYCKLRSVSPIHIEYLQNMGVAASFSLSVVVNNELKSLIACHHLKPRYLNYYQRRAAELFARVLSEHFAKRQIEKRREQHDDQLKAQVKLICQLGDTGAVDADNKAWEQAFSMIRADAFFVKFGESRRIIGDKPEGYQAIWQLGDRMATHNSSTPSSTRSLKEFDASHEGGGLLIVPINVQNWVAWYRQSENQQVRWAGKPDLAQKQNLTPRTSFESWQEVIEGQASNWTESDMDMADLLARGLSARLGGVLDSDESFEQMIYRLREYILFLQDSNRMLSNLNEDLRQFTDVASHDMRAPLRTIASFLPLIRKEIEASLSDRAKVWMRYVDNSVTTMQRLLDGLWNFSVVGREINTESVDLNAIVQSVLDSLADELEGVEIHVDSLPMVKGIRSQLEALMRNLIGNASKYRDPQRNLKLVIAARNDGKNQSITVSDNGIGFPTSAKEEIFDLFSRLHHNQTAGDGLGLALCRRIVHHHRGWIRAESEPGKGATFEFMIREPKLLPKQEG